MLNAKDLAEFFMLTTGILFTTTLGFAALWIRARERAIRARAEQPREVATRSDEIDHLVNAVDAIAVEVERISEAQRFTAKVLVERPETGVSPKRVPERVITPH